MNSSKDWSKDGRYIAYKARAATAYDDLYVAAAGRDGKPGKPFAIVQGKYQKDEPQFSYDGKWLAYASDESDDVPGVRDDVSAG